MLENSLKKSSKKESEEIVDSLKEYSDDNLLEVALELVKECKKIDSKLEIARVLSLFSVLSKDHLVFIRAKNGLWEHGINCPMSYFDENFLETLQKNKEDWKKAPKGIQQSLGNLRHIIFFKDHLIVKSLIECAN